MSVMELRTYKVLNTLLFHDSNLSPPDYKEGKWFEEIKTK